MRREEEVEMNINNGGEEYEVEDVRDKMESSRGSRFRLIENDLVGIDLFRRKISRQSVINGLKDLSHFVIHPENRWYRMWENFILIWSIYSSFFTPMEFAFFNGLPRKLFLLDICGQIVFLVDIVLQFFVAYRDSQTYKMVYKRTPIALRYLKSHFIMDFLSCMPWDVIYKAVGSKEEVRYLLWIRLSRARRITYFFQKMEKDIRINYLFTRIIKLITVELYCTHTAACIFYYLATTLSEQQEGYTWIGSLKLGDYSYSNFRDIDLWTRYVTSMYFAIVTMATVGYGDIHAVNLREMIFVMIYVSFDMILGAYLIGNMTALIVKGSKTERYRDKTTDLLKYMNRNRLGRDIRNQIKGHLRLQYESAYTDAAVLQDIPISIRAKISQNLYQSYIENVPLFKGCSSEFISQVSIAMDKRALYRAKLKEQKQKRIDSPLVRYNENDQPVCRVCDVVLKSESQWPGHQASRKHHEAINNLKANAAAAKNPNNVKSEPPKELPKPKPEIPEGVSRKEPEPSVGLSKPRASSMLPPNFFDNQETKRPKIEKDSARLGDHVPERDSPVSDRTEEVEPSLARSSSQGLSTSKNAETRSMENQRSGENGPVSKVSSGSDAKQVKGALPAGFFDNKDADLRARGITPVKPDVKDEYKEFEKLIQEDLKEVDNRLEEEEIDAAEMIEEEVSVEQRGYRERLEMLRRKKMELKAAKSSLGSKEIKVVNKESSDDESSSDDDSDENTVDWRAKHL